VTKLDIDNIILEELTKPVKEQFSSIRKSTISGSAIDNNLFFLMSAAILNQNKQIQNNLDNAVVQRLSSYRNKFERHSYNFWSTEPYNQYPNSKFLGRIKHFLIPDDLDCSALALHWLNNSSVDKTIEECRRFYRPDLGFIPTWFGLKMPAEFDLCVCMNYLYTLKLIGVDHTEIEISIEKKCVSIIQNNTWYERGFYYSPNYQSPSIISTHIARWLTSSSEVIQNKMKLPFINTINNLLGLASAVEDRVYYNLALQYLGQPTEISLSDDDIKHFLDSSSFFKAPMLSNSSINMPAVLKRSKLLNLNFICRPFNAIVLKSVLKND